VLNSNDTVGSLEFGNHDIAAPTMVSLVINLNAPRQSITAQFSEDVSASLSGADVVLENLTTATTIQPQDLAIDYDLPSNTATITYLGNSAGILPDGNYHVTILAAGVSDASSNTLTANQTTDFFVLAGDANHDRTVDVTDLGFLATYWQESPRTFAQGDFNYDQTVDVTDLGILATNWQNSLPAPAPALATPLFASAPIHKETSSASANPLLEILA
jgi:hypothetical protein